MQITRRDSLLMMSAAAALSLTGAGAATAADGTLFDVAKLMSPAGGLADHVFGNADAPVTLIEYASPTCPHCAAFANDVFPGIKAAFVDTGKVKFILRPFVRNILDAVVFMLAEAAGPENYLNVVDTYFRTQADWQLSATPKDAMLAVATQLGFTAESFDSALTNQTLFAGLEAMREQAVEDFKLEGTPTFYLNGKQLTGEKSFEELATEINALLPADQKGPDTDPLGASGTPAPTGETSTPVTPDAGASTPVAPETPAPDAMAPAAPAPDAMAPAAPEAMAPAAPAAQ